MKKLTRLLELALALCLVGVPVATIAQQPDKLPRLGWLGNFSTTAPVYGGFRQGLRELGYVEGRNIIIEARWAEGNLDRLPELARELARLNVNVMFVGGDQGLRAAKEATTTIPIVVLACDPLDSLVASIARPGGKATGLTCISSELASKRLQMLKELVPGFPVSQSSTIRRIATRYWSTNKLRARVGRSSSRCASSRPAPRSRSTKHFAQWPTIVLRPWLSSPTRSWFFMKRSSQSSRCRTGSLQYSVSENLPIWEVSSPTGRAFASNFGAPRGSWTRF